MSLNWFAMRTTIVPTYDWTTFFAPHLKKLIGIKKYHHFRFTSSEPGVVYVKEHADTAEVRMDLNKSSTPWVPDKNELPSVVSPKGLSAERQWYLYEHIRPFCPDSDKDITCPLPTCPNPTSTRGTPARDATPAPDPDTVEPQAKRKRLCGTCRICDSSSTTPSPHSISSSQASSSNPTVDYLYLFSAL